MATVLLAPLYGVYNGAILGKALTDVRRIVEITDLPVLVDVDTGGVTGAACSVSAEAWSSSP
jgi:2-methylisocitrate lyase-like PEP mutase family enzyme